MNETNLQTIELEEETLSRKNEFFQIDFLKAVMIFLVIFDHCVSWNIKNNIAVALWERISIPVFLVILGFNMGNSFREKGYTSLKQLYSWSYFKKKFMRYVLPFLILYAASTFIGLFMYGFDFETMYFTYRAPEEGVINLILLYLPFWGPGNWFISVLISSIFVMPLLYWGFTKRPVITVILMFVIEIGLRVIVIFVVGESFTSWEEGNFYSLISGNVLYRLSAVGLGLWFSKDHDLQSKHNFFMWFLYPLSLAYLVAYQFLGFRFRFEAIPLLRGDYHFLVFPYSAFIVLLALKFLPKKWDSWFGRLISTIGKSTYHILLTQILGYGMITAFWGTHYIIDGTLNPSNLINNAFNLGSLWLAFISFGIVWYKIDQQRDLKKRVLYYLNLFIIFPCLFFLTFWAQASWVPIPLIAIILYAIAVVIRTYTIKIPLSTGRVAVWTGFLLISFISMILQVSVVSPGEHWLLLLPMGIYLIVVFFVTR